MDKLFKGKPVKVVITGKALESFEELTKTVAEEISKGITSSNHQTLFNSIRRKVELLKENPHCGTQVQKNLIPKEYIEIYDASNLWKLNLPGALRMIYTIRTNEVKIIALILDVLKHRKYEKKFGYKKS
ncbi:MAG: hypothetical protein ABIG20_05535 [archaeon]